MRIVLDGSRGEVDWEIRPRAAQRLDENTFVFSERRRDPEGAEWLTQLKVTLRAAEPVAILRYEWQCTAPRRVKALWGPDVRVGEGTTCAGKTWGLLPGVEFLYDGEPSSNGRDLRPPLDDRRTPNPRKLTIPLMVVSVAEDSPAPPQTVDRSFCPDSLLDLTGIRDLPMNALPLTVALHWDPAQKWDGERTLLSPRFSSPNLDEGQDNHRLGLFLPSCPEFVSENADRAFWGTTYPLEPGRVLSLEAAIAVDAGPVMVAVQRWLEDIGGLPVPNQEPRPYEEELALCRDGFLYTVWDEKAEKWRHCIGWEPMHTPGFATLLWLDAHLAQDPEARRQSLERAQLTAGNMLRDQGPGSLIATTNCHIMRWEFPFHYGFLPEAMTALDEHVRGITAQQKPDGSWRFQPEDPQHAALGRTGDAVLGTCAGNAYVLTRYARITGDEAATRASEKALRLMEGFRVPRGGQTWECPMYEPDVLSAAIAVAAYLEGFWATGNPR